MNIQSQLINIPAFLIFFVLTTVPIVFGAIHPVVFATYTAIVLIGIGGWLSFSSPLPETETISKKWLIPVILVLLFSAFQAIPVPLAFLEIVSPLRSARVEMLNATLIIASVAYCRLVGLRIHGIADFGWRLPANLFYAVTLAALVSYGLDIEESSMDVAI